MTVNRHQWTAALGAFALFSAAAANAASVTRGPYLQSVTESSATVVFRLDSSCSALVRVSTPDGSTAPATALSASGGSFHAIQLTGLAPGRQYSYSVEACGAPSVGASGSFRTPRPAELRTVHFGVVGDSGTGGNSQTSVVGRIAAEKPEMILTMGDNAYSNGSDAEYQSRFFDPMARVLRDVPLWPSMGNHEYGTNDGQPYLDAFVLPTNNPLGSERYYSFDWGSAHFVILDSSCATGYSDACTLIDQQVWMEQDLRASKADWKIVVFHHPPYSSGEHGSQLKLRQSWSPILESTGVDLVLTGHDHNYERSKPMKGGAVSAAAPGSPTYLVVGNGGANLRAWPVAQPEWSAYRNNSDYGYLDVKISGGTLTAQMRTASGAVADTFTLGKALGPVTPSDDGSGSGSGSGVPGATGEGGFNPDGTTVQAPDGADDAPATGCGASPTANAAGRLLWLFTGALLVAVRRRWPRARARPRSDGR